MSGFLLQYRPEQNGKWQFLLPGADKTDAQNQEFVLRRRALRPRTPGLTSSASTTSPPSRSGSTSTVMLEGTAARSNGFDAAGSLVVGRGRWQSEARAFWRGSVDEVRAYSRELSVEEIRGIVSQDHVTRGTWKLDAQRQRRLRPRPHRRRPPGPPSGPAARPPTRTRPTSRCASTAPTPTSAPRTPWTPTRASRWRPGPSWTRSAGTRRWCRRTAAGSARSSSRPRRRGAGRFTMFGADADGGGSVHDRVIGGARADRRLDAPGRGVRRGGEAEHDLRQRGARAAPSRTPAPGTTPPAACRSAGPQWNGVKLDYFAGAIDDVSVYSRVLFANEIQTMAGRDLSLVHNWQLDEPSGTNAADAVGARNGDPDRRRGVRARPGRQRRPARRRGRRGGHHRRGPAYRPELHGVGVGLPEQQRLRPRRRSRAASSTR